MLHQRRADARPGAIGRRSSRYRKCPARNRSVPSDPAGDGALRFGHKRLKTPVQARVQRSSMTSRATSISSGRKACAYRKRRSSAGDPPADAPDAHGRAGWRCARPRRAGIMRRAAFWIRQRMISRTPGGGGRSGGVTAIRRQIGVRIDLRSTGRPRGSSRKSRAHNRGSPLRARRSARPARMRPLGGGQTGGRRMGVARLGRRREAILPHSHKSAAVWRPTG
jgi:hypothetical protein